MDREGKIIYIYIYVHRYLENGVIYWALTELSIKRCICVNKWKSSGSRWALDNNITRCPGQFKSVGDRMPKWEPAPDRGLWAISDPRLSNPAKMRKKCCYGQRRTWGQYSSLSPSPTHLSHTTNITPSRIKWERLYFYKAVYSFVHWSSYIMFDYVSAYTCITAIQHQLAG